MNNKPILLIIDDEKTILKTLQEALEDENYRVKTLNDGKKVIDTIGKLIPDLVLLDIFMPNCNGIQLLEQIKKEYPQQKVMMISGFGNISIAIEAVKKGAIDFIEKPLNLDEILSKISFLKEKKKHPKKLITQDSSNDFKNHNIIGQSYLFLELMQQSQQLSKLNLPILIYGQHGTGKSLIAKYIYKNSHLSKEQFITIDCSSLIEKEFIKKIKSAFLDIKCTIFIKSINNLSIKNQKLLLSTILNNKVRLIISSTQSLLNLVSQNKFDSALFHKLNVAPIEVPPLNKRRYDIPLLIDSFLQQENQKQKKSIIFNTKSLRHLRNHNWQGNVTELKELINRIVSIIDEHNKVITPEVLTTFLGEKKSQIIEEQSFLHFNSLNEATSEFEKKYLLFLLKKNYYNLKQVSDCLNLTPIQLRDKIIKHKIDVKI